MTRHNNSDVENFFITASKEELIDYLVKKINSEVEKGDDADCDLIRECSDWLDELTEDEIVFTPEELERNLERIKAKVASNKPIKIRKKASWKIFVRVTLAAAVLFTISIIALSTMASNKGYNSTWEYIADNVGKWLGLNTGEEFDLNGISFVKYSDSICYSDMSELLDKENLDILYPRLMPENIVITEVRFVPKSDEKYFICFTFSNEIYVLNVSNFYSTDVSQLNDFENITINNYDCYITKKKEEDLYFGVLQHNGFEYTIQSPSYDNLLSIINNMEG